MPEIVLSLTEGDERDIKQIAHDRNEREIGPENDQEAIGIDASMEKRFATKMAVLGKAFCAYAEGIHALTKELHKQNPELPPDELAIMVKKIAIEKGITAPPSLNLCTVAVPGTNMFCGGAKKIDRVQMPQLKSLPVEGSDAWKRAEAAGSDPRSTSINAEADFLAFLKKNKIAVTEGERMSPNEMSATQSHLNADKVAGMAYTLLRDPDADKDSHPLRAPLLVSADGYVLDGHHRWAALATYDIMRGRGDVSELKVTKIDLEIEELVDVANKFTDEFGLQRKALNKTTMKPGQTPTAPKAPTSPKAPKAPVAPKASKGVSEKKPETKPSKMAESRLLTEDTVNLVDYNTARSLAQKAGFNPDRAKGRLMDIVFKDVPAAARALKTFGFRHEEGEIAAIEFFDKLPAKHKSRASITINGIPYLTIERWELEERTGVPVNQVDPAYDREVTSWRKQAFDLIARALKMNHQLQSRTQTRVTMLSEPGHVKLSGRSMYVMVRGRWEAITDDQIADLVQQTGARLPHPRTITESKLFEQCDSMSAERVTQMLQSQIGKEYYAVDRADFKQVVKQTGDMTVELAKGKTWGAALRVARDKFKWARDLVEANMGDIPKKYSIRPGTYRDKDVFKISGGGVNIVAKTRKQAEYFVQKLKAGKNIDYADFQVGLDESTMLKENTDINALLKSAGINLRSTVSSKDPATMTAAEINKDLDAVDKISSAHTDAMIAAGRGSERPSEYLKASDPLSKLARAVFDRRSDLKNEVQMRYGNNISRLPTGKNFGPRKKLGESTMPVINEDAKSVTCPECDKSFKNAPNGKLPVHSIYGERCPGSGQLGESKVDSIVATVIEATTLSVADQMRMDNKFKRQSVVSVTRDKYFLNLNLTDGGSIRLPKDQSVKDALKFAADRGFDVSKVKVNESKSLTEAPTEGIRVTSTAFELSDALAKKVAGAVESYAKAKHDAYFNIRSQEARVRAQEELDNIHSVWLQLASTQVGGQSIIKSGWRLDIVRKALKHANVNDDALKVLRESKSLTESTDADNQLHAFNTFMGMPPDTDDQPVCGAVISKDYGKVRPTQRCPKCDRLVRLAKSARSAR